MKKSLLIIIVLIVTIFSCNKDVEPVASQTQSDYDKEIFDLINTHRQSVGLKSLEFRIEIWNGTYEHSKNMADGTIEFSHDGYSERFAAIREEMGFFGGLSGENVAYGAKTATEVVEGWLSSEQHKGNIERAEFTFSAVSAVKVGNSPYYYTQIFMRE